MVQAIKNDKNTSIMGVLVIAFAVIKFLMALFDNDPDTVADLEAVLNLLGFGSVGSGLLFAGDGGKKNERPFKSNRSNPGNIR